MRPPVVALARGLLDWLGRFERTGRIVGGVLLVAAIATNGYAVRVALEAQQREREGRVVAVTATCGVADAVASAGRRVLQARTGLPAGRFRRNLERLGYEAPASASRQAIADAYVATIRKRVERITGRTDLVKADGTLDCDRLREVAAP